MEYEHFNDDSELTPEEQECIVYCTYPDKETTIKIDLEAVDRLRLPARIRLMLLRHRIVVQD